MKHKIVEQWLEEYEFGKVRLVVQLENGNKFTQVITAVDKYGYNISIWEPTKEPKEPAPKVPEKYNNMQQLDKPPAPTVINLLKCIKDPDIRDKALKNLFTDFRNANVGNIADAINIAFIWKDTVEGYEYWHQVYNIYSTGKYKDYVVSFPH